MSIYHGLIKTLSALRCFQYHSYKQGSCCLSEIYVNQRQTLHILHQRYEKCIQHQLELAHKLPKLKWRSSQKWANENSKVCPCTKKWKRTVNLPFRKSLRRSGHHTRHHFPKMNNSRWCWETQFSSTTGFGNEMKSISRLPVFYLTHIHYSVWTCILFAIS